MATFTHPVPSKVMDRFWSRVAIGAPDECWPWLLSTGSHGYGQIGWNLGNGKATMVLAHRLAWYMVHGEIPDDLTVDHRCHVRTCCNPNHLRLLTRSANSSDNGFSSRTHCPGGHPYDSRNTYLTPRGYRRCRVCARERDRGRF